MSPNIVACVIVLFKPPNYTIDTVVRLANFGYSLVVVINDIDDKSLFMLRGIVGVHIIHNEKNVGLATALNQGIKYAFEKLNSSYVNLYDQDSLPDDNLPLNLVAEIEASRNINCACIGPNIVDVKIDGNKKGGGAPHSLLLDPQTIITSGTLISKEMWLSIGPMLDFLFIDGVDHEWCLRARSMGYNICVSSLYTMLHNMGDDCFYFFGKYKPIHRSPIRHYYIIRNSIYLLSVTYVPLRWKILEFFKTIRRIPFYLFASNRTIESLTFIVLAVRDGFLMRSGVAKTHM